QVREIEAPRLVAARIACVNQRVVGDLPGEGHQTREAVVGKARRPTGDRIEIAADRDHCGGERTRQGPWVDTCGPELVERPSLPLPRIAKPRGEAQPVVDLPVKLTKEGEALGR